MEVEKGYYSANDVMKILAVSRSKAYEILNMFAYHGKALRVGKTLRVKITDFDSWIKTSMQQTQHNTQNWKKGR